MILTYNELLEIPTFEERLDYLQLDALPGDMTFGSLRHLNQTFYRSSLWKQVRRAIIARDLGYDLAVPGQMIRGNILVHHLNPITPKDIWLHRECVIDPENLVTVSFDTHNSIHFGAEPVTEVFVERQPSDTQLWRRTYDNT